MEKIKTLFLGKNKEAVKEALLSTLKDNNFDVVGVACSKGGMLWQAAKSYGLKTYSNKSLYNSDISSQIDLALSFLYPRKIKEPLISTPKLGCLNFHPAPLPKYRGVANYSRAILNGDNCFGVTCHYVDEGFDTGEIVEVRHIAMDQEETSYTLEKKSLSELYCLYLDILVRISNSPGQRLPSKDQRDYPERPIYTSISDIDFLREVKPGDSEEVVSRKVRAFWFPPFPGASIRVGNKEFTLIDTKILHQVSDWKKNSGEV